MLQSIAGRAGLHAGDLTLSFLLQFRPTTLYPIDLENVPLSFFKNIFVMSNFSGQSTGTDLYPQSYVGQGWEVM